MAMQFLIEAARLDEYRRAEKNGSPIDRVYLTISDMFDGSVFGLSIDTPTDELEQLTGTVFRLTGSLEGRRISSKSGGQMQILSLTDVTYNILMRQGDLKALADKAATAAANGK